MILYAVYGACAWLSGMLHCSLTLWRRSVLRSLLIQLLNGLLAPQAMSVALWTSLLLAGLASCCTTIARLTGGGQAVNGKRLSVCAGELGWFSSEEA